MHPVRTLARPLLASVFVTGGIDTLRRASSLAPVAEPVTTPMVDAAQPVVDRAAEAAAPAVEAATEKAADGAGQADYALRFQIPDDPELLTTVNGGVMVAAGILLGLGRFPRLSAAALAATLVPTTLAAHRFWEVEDDEERAEQQFHFMKNVGLLGGLALAAVDTEGRPGLTWRARHATRTARREARRARRLATDEASRRARGAAQAVVDVIPVVG